MDWNIAEAKQRFSEVVKFAVQEPQMIYNRSQPVAALIAAEEFAHYQAWKAEQTRPRSMAEEFAELRKLLIDAGCEDGLELPPRTTRPNAFDEMLEQEYPTGAGQ
ncbi:MAG: type II toxin-antitoxin system Phd/YefM family antitoxin [Betaproteobacteria bacterium]|nr:type II toxin-antitoxin system Phd/YefM family antitoxin [Betaproteobacteria bacterium]